MLRTASLCLVLAAIAACNIIAGLSDLEKGQSQSGAGAGGAGTSSGGEGPVGGQGGQASIPPLVLAAVGSADPAWLIRHGSTGGRLYWSEWAGAQIRYVDSPDGSGGWTATVLAKKSQSPWFMTLVKPMQALVWTQLDDYSVDGRPLWAASLDGVYAQEFLGSPNTVNPTRLCSDAAGVVYWIDQNEEDSYSVFRGAQPSAGTGGSGGNPIWTPQHSTLLFSQTGKGLYIATDGTSVYWSVDLGNETSNLLKTDASTGGIAETIASGGKITSLALDTGNVYYADEDAGTISRVSKAGGTSPTLLQSGLDSPTDIALEDAGYMYWSSPQEGQILRAPKEPAGTVQVLATGQITPFAVTVDEKYVYWANSSSSVATINRVPKCAATPSSCNP